MPRARPMWECPRCGRRFANRNQAHACGPLGELESHFAGTEPAVRQTFCRVLELVQRIGPVTVLPERTRIALQARISFAAFMPRRRWLDGHVILAERLHSRRFTRVETFSPRNVLHAFRLHAPEEVDDEVAGWLRRAYEVGEQRHLGRSS